MLLVYEIRNNQNVGLFSERTLANYMSWKFVLSYMSFMSMPFRQIFQDYTLLTPELRNSKLKTNKEKYTEVLKKFEEYCLPRQNVVYERYKFFSCVQQEGQSIESYVTQLKTLASTCEFADQEDGLIRDRIVLGIRDNRLKERLLRESSLEVGKVVEIVRAAESSREQIRSMNDEKEVHTMRKHRKKVNQKQPSLEYECKKCGKTHKPRECPAFGKTCSRCKQKNHFAVRCPQNSKKIYQAYIKFVDGV